MVWEIFQSTLGIFTSIIASIGGAGALMYIVSSHLGEVWARRYLESVKKDYQLEIEQFRTQMVFLKETLLRYSGRQFELYSKLWHSLCDLKSAADSLWSNASETNLKKFSQQLSKTMNEVEKGYLFLEENHYQELKKLLSAFSEYEIGKTRLIQFYKRRGTRIDSNQIQQYINNNKKIKQEYEQLICKIGMELKRQLTETSNLAFNV